MRQLTCLILTALLLGGCFDSGGGGGGGGKSTGSGDGGTTTTGGDTTGKGDDSASGGKPPVAQARLLDVFFAQTHVLRPQDRFFRLVGERDALYLARVENASQALRVEVLDRSGSLLGSRPLVSPAQLDKTAGNGPAPFTLAHSVRLPAALVRPGMQVRLLHGEQNLGLEKPDVGAPTVITHYSVPFVLFGRSLDSLPADGLAMSAERTREYAARLPVSRFDYRAAPPLRLDRLILRPTGSAPGEALPVWPDCPTTQAQSPVCDGYRAMGGVLDYLHLLKNANGEGDIAHYYGLVFHPRHGGDGYSTIWGGLGGGNVGTGDNWGDVMIHEMGHAYGLGHAGSDYQSTFSSEFNSHFVAGAKRFPYAASLPGDSGDNGNVGDTWGYDLERREFIPPYLYKADGSIKQHKQDPMQGGAGHRETGYLYSMFADANVSRIQTHLEGYTGSAGKLHYDATSGKLLRWNYAQEQYQSLPYPQPCGQTPYCYGPGGLGELPIEHRQPVLTLLGSISRTTPALTLIHPPYARNGNLVRLYDPTLAADLQELTDQYRWYCAASGCQYVLRLSERLDGQLRQRHILLRTGFFAWHQWEKDSLKAGADDANSGDSFTRWAVNIRPQGSLEKVEVLFKDHAERGMSAGEGQVVASWSAP